MRLIVLNEKELYKLIQFSVGKSLSALALRTFSGVCQQKIAPSVPTLTMIF